jgi:hypothetical protein
MFNKTTSEAGLLNKSSHLAPALGAAKLIPKAGAKQEPLFNKPASHSCPYSQILD